MPTPARYRPSVRHAIGILVLGAVVAVGCGSDDSGGPVNGGALGGPAPLERSLPATVGSADTVVTPGSIDLDAGRSLVVRGSATVLVDDVEDAVEVVRRVADAAGAELVASDVALEGDRPTARLTYRVLPDRYRDLVASFAGIGKLLAEESSVDDVTGTVVDLDARIEATEISVERLRDLLARTADVAALTAVEAELATREADLAALRAARSALGNLVDRATLTVVLTATDPATSLEEPPAGFVDGVRAGWDVVVAIGRAIAVVAGFGAPVAPFAVVLVVVVRLLRWRRRRRRAARLAAAPPPPPPAT
ncbi:MAG: DUF4349 domain-containing protein [Actinobacteria bacterium]|nr:DUF4349 domain-containing protein [Actinomycetota bacterium]